jgi:hypothetical protein
MYEAEIPKISHDRLREASQLKRILNQSVIRAVSLEGKRSRKIRLTHIVQNVLCCDGLLSDTALSEGNVLRDRLIEVVTYLERRGVEKVVSTRREGCGGGR